MASQDWFDKDFYKVLGVDKTASDAELKKTYRKLARQYHPDSNPGDAAAEARFKEISEAYSVLSDKDQRAEYDQVRAMGSGLASPRVARAPRAASRTSSAACSAEALAEADSACASARAVAAASRTSSAGCSVAGAASASRRVATAASAVPRRVRTSRRRRRSTSRPRSPATPSSSRRATAVR